MSPCIILRANLQGEMSETVHLTQNPAHSQHLLGTAVSYTFTLSAIFQLHRSEFRQQQELIQDIEAQPAFNTFK